MAAADPDPLQYLRSRPPSRVWTACYCLLGVVLAYVLIARWFLPICVREPIGVERSAGPGEETRDDRETAGAADERIDPNTADWPELTRLPGIGEVIAKRIVAYRRERQDGSGRPVFRSAADLARVRGIGPKTVEAIEPHLRFPGPVSPEAEGDTTTAPGPPAKAAPR